MKSDKQAAQVAAASQQQPQQFAPTNPLYSLLHKMLRESGFGANVFPLCVLREYSIKLLVLLCLNVHLTRVHWDVAWVATVLF